MYMYTRATCYNHVDYCTYSYTLFQLLESCLFFSLKMYVHANCKVSMHTTLQCQMVNMLTSLPCYSLPLSSYCSHSLRRPVCNLRLMSFQRLKNGVQALEQVSELAITVSSPSLVQLQANVHMFLQVSEYFFERVILS